jgi:hypothetical protein
MALKVANKKKQVQSANAFAGQIHPPTQKAVAEVLGPGFELWKQLIADLKRDLDLDSEEWNSSGVKYGWSLRLQKRKRNIVYLGPRAGMLVAAFVLGDKAVAAARRSELPVRVLRVLAESKRYAEGTALRIEVAGPGDLQVVRTLARIKVEN